MPTTCKLEINTNRLCIEQFKIFRIINQSYIDTPYIGTVKTDKTVLTFLQFLSLIHI